MSDISKVVLPNDETVYNLKDERATAVLKSNMHLNNLISNSDFKNAINSLNKTSYESTNYVW